MESGAECEQPPIPSALKKSAYGQTRKMRPENGQISYKIVWCIFGRFKYIIEN